MATARKAIENVTLDNGRYTVVYQESGLRRSFSIDSAPASVREWFEARMAEETVTETVAEETAAEETAAETVAETNETENMATENETREEEENMMIMNMIDPAVKAAKETTVEGLKMTANGLKTLGIGILDFIVIGLQILAFVVAPIVIEAVVTFVTVTVPKFTVEKAIPVIQEAAKNTKATIKGVVEEIKNTFTANA